MPHQTSPFVFLVKNFGAFSSGMTTWGAHEEENEVINLLLPTIQKYAKEFLDTLKIDKEKKIAPEILNQAKALGLFGLTIPEEYGGSGLSLKAACRVIAEAASYDSAVSTTIGLHGGLGLRGINHFGSKKLKDLYLEDLATGEKIASFAATETSAGSHISNVQTQATYDERTNQITVNGSKIYVTNGGFADLYTILASTPDLRGHKKGLSLILVPRTAEGVIVGEEEDKLGLRGSSTTTLYFEDVKLDADHIIGTPGEALQHFEDVLSWGRTLMSAGCLGTARSAFQKARDYALIRHQFGEAIGRFALIQEKISQMSQCLYSMESIVQAVGQTQIAGRDVVFESSVAKIVCSEGSGWVCDEAIQIHGGSGYIEETGVAKLYRDVRITRIFEGSNEMLRLHIALQILSWNRGDLEKLSFSPEVDEALASCMRECEKAYQGFLSVFTTLKKKYKFSILKKQLALKHLSEAAIAMYSMGSVLARTDGQLKSNLSEKDKSYSLALCQAIIFHGRQRIAEITKAVEEELPYSHETIANLAYERK